MKKISGNKSEDQAIEFNNSINSPERERNLREDENQITKEYLVMGVGYQGMKGLKGMGGLRGENRGWEGWLQGIFSGF